MAEEYARTEIPPRDGELRAGMEWNKGHSYKKSASITGKTQAKELAASGRGMVTWITAMQNWASGYDGIAGGNL